MRVCVLGDTMFGGGLPSLERDLKSTELTYTWSSGNTKWDLKKRSNTLRFTILQLVPLVGTALPQLTIFYRARWLVGPSLIIEHCVPVSETLTGYTCNTADWDVVWAAARRSSQEAARLPSTWPSNCTVRGSICIWRRFWICFMLLLTNVITQTKTYILSWRVLHAQVSKDASSSFPRTLERFSGGWHKLLHYMHHFHTLYPAIKLDDWTICICIYFHLVIEMDRAF